MAPPCNIKPRPQHPPDKICSRGYAWTVLTKASLSLDVCHRARGAKTVTVLVYKNMENGFWILYNRQGNSMQIAYTIYSYIYEEILP